MDVYVNNVIVPVRDNQKESIREYLSFLGIKDYMIKNIKINKRSIDSRQKKSIKFLYNLQVTLKGKEIAPSDPRIISIKESLPIQRIGRYPGKEVIVVGSGPAGLFSALRLAEYGYIPLVFEQGEEVNKRIATCDKFVNDRVLNEKSNIQFGEGGAGTFSDGKLNTRVKSEYIEKVFEEFVDCGAQKEILWDYKPHIGTDILRKVVKNMRNKIIKKGGKFYFDTKVENILIENNKVRGIKILKKDGNIEKIHCDSVILAIGHSARDTYKMLYKNNIEMEAKAFAVGVRIEHLREDIDIMQYGSEKYLDILGAATYNVTFNNPKENRGTFSFCMCPGGEIVNATSIEKTSLVNGMSYSTRNGKFSNSAIVVGIKENEFGNDIFSNMRFQEEIEKKSYDVFGKYGGLYQTVKDFLEDKNSVEGIESSYKMELKSYNFKKIFPEFINNNLKLALSHWSKNNYFINKSTNLIGPETRTSAPVRILRDKYGESVNIKGLFPVGEGAGYAGGITSSAIDGIKIVDFSFANVL